MSAKVKRNEVQKKVSVYTPSAKLSKLNNDPCQDHHFITFIVVDIIIFTVVVTASSWSSLLHKDLETFFIIFSLVNLNRHKKMV